MTILLLIVFILLLLPRGCLRNLIMLFVFLYVFAVIDEAKHPGTYYHIRH